MQYPTVPTTAGTGSEVGRSTVVSDDETKAEKIIFSPHLMPNRFLSNWWQNCYSRRETLAAELMADTAYGLTVGVYTQNQAWAEAILSQLKTGTVYWNCCDRVSPRLPGSGRGHSGVGLTLSTYGIQTFTQPKAWHLKASYG